MGRQSSELTLSHVTTIIRELHSNGFFTLVLQGASQVALVVTNPPANAGDLRDEGSIPGSGRSPGEENGNLLQYSCLKNPMDRRAWQAMVHRVTKSQT